MSTEPQAPPAGRSRRYFGIRSKLYFWLGGAVAITLTVSLVAVAVFHEVENRQIQVTEEFLPALTASLHMAQQSATLAALAPRLRIFDDPAERDRARQQIDEERRLLQESTGRLLGIAAGQERLQPIRENIASLASSLEILEQVASTRHDTEAKLEASAARMQQTHRDLGQVLTPLLDDAAFAVVTGYTDLDDETPLTLAERASPANLLAFEALWRISTEANLMRGLMSGAVYLPRIEFLQPTRERFDAAAGRLRRALQVLQSAPKVDPLVPIAESLVRFGVGSEGLFELRRQVLVQNELEQTLIQQSRQSAETLTGQVRALVRGTERNAIAATDAVARVLAAGEGLLLGLNVVSLLGAVLIAWLFVDRLLMRRLAALATKMREMAAGEITVPVESSGNDEVTEMAEALEVFRAHALEVRRLNLVEKLANELNEKNTELQDAFDQLKAAQDRIVTQEKLASLGQLTAGIAHEIKNPLNFVNNFSGLSVDLLDELRDHLDGLKAKMDKEVQEDVEDLIEDLTLNLDKIKQHGQRADSIVRGMLDHSRESTGEFEVTDINQLLEEYVGLAYHGMRAQDQSFNVTIEQEYGEDVVPVPLVRQDFGRALLNIITNALQALQERAQNSGEDYTPTVNVSTRRADGKIEIRIRDNGPGIPESIAAEIFSPFFTTKPTGMGTGLGLSITYDIVVQQHGGELKVESEEGEFTEFMLEVPERAAEAA